MTPSRKRQRRGSPRGESGSGPGRAGSPRKLPLGKKLLFSLVATLAPFLVAELVLTVVGVRPVLYDEDPYVGFSAYNPLFVEEPATDPPRLITARNKRVGFNLQSFPRDKPPGTYRIFCLGGSTTYGRPYDDATSFPGWLRELLADAAPDAAYEVINAGGLSYASYRVSMLMEELSRYEPDLFVVYSAHNEFLETRTYAAILETPMLVRNLTALLSRTRTYSALRRLLLGDRSTPPDEVAQRAMLPDEVDAALDHAVGLEAYSRDDEFQSRVLAHYRHSLERMIDIAETAGARLVFVEPASNLRDCSPFKSEHRSDFSDADRARWQQRIEEADLATRRNDPLGLLAAIDGLIALDPRFAHAHYQRGRVLLELGRTDEARAAFVRAREEDVCPLRGLTSIRRIVREVAEANGVSLVEFGSEIERRSPAGIPGADLFLDHVHPTIEGNRVLARLLLDTMIEMGVVEPDASWNDAAVQRVVARVEGRLDRQSHARARLNLSKVLGWAGKSEEGDRLALDVVGDLPDDANAHYLAGIAEARRGNARRARVHYREAIRLEPLYWRAHLNLGVLYAQDWQMDEAVEQFRHAVRIHPSTETYYNLCGAYFEMNRPGDTATCFEEVVRRTPDHADARNYLGIAYAKLQRYDEAREQFERALSIRPDYDEARQHLERLRARAGSP